MRRFARRSSAVCSAVSLLLPAFVVALWFRSYAVGEQVGYRVVGAGGSVTQTSLATFAGRLALTRSGVVAPGTTERSGWYVGGWHPRPGYAIDGVAGFEFRHVAAQALARLARSRKLKPTRRRYFDGFRRAAARRDWTPFLRRSRSLGFS